MKKCTVFLIVISLLAFSLTACSNDNDEQPEVPFLERPDTNLDFWIADNVDNVDFSEYTYKGLMGGWSYYGKEYDIARDEYDQPIAPEHYVLYTVTNFPDYSDKAEHITDIRITDPEIYIYGSLTVESSFEDFKRVMEQNGFEIVEKSEYSCRMKKGKFTISLTPHHHLLIMVEVENREGIYF